MFQDPVEDQPGVVVSLLGPLGELAGLKEEAPDAVAVVGRPDDRWGELVTAVAVLHIEVPVAPQELIAFAKSKLAGYKCPKIVEFADALPYGPTGKILTRQLRRPKESSTAQRSMPS